MLPVLLLLAATALPASTALAPATALAASACRGADPAVTDVSSQLIKKRAAPDHYVITATITNIGPRTQSADIRQRVTLIRNGTVLAPQLLPALGAGVNYTVAFAVYRPSAERSRPLTFTLRYQLLAGDAALNACNRSNDEVTKTF